MYHFQSPNLCQYLLLVICVSDGWKLIYKTTGCPIEIISNKIYIFQIDNCLFGAKKHFLIFYRFFIQFGNKSTTDFFVPKRFLMFYRFFIQVGTELLQAQHGISILYPVRHEKVKYWNIYIIHALTKLSLAPKRCFRRKYQDFIGN